jgi:inositol-phosphate transport system permease protein
MIWKYLAADAPYGVFNQFLAPLGVAPQNWVLAAPWVMVILVNGFIGASFGMIIFTSAIESIPIAYIHASRVDGATALQTIRHIILPLLRWPLLFVLTYQTLSLLTSFEQILLLTDGGPGYFTTETWALQAYHRALSNYFGNVNFGFGASLAAVLVLIGIILAIVYLRVFRFGELVQEPKIETL